jgi:hypothetical protein
MEQKFCFVQGFAYKQKQKTFKKPMTSYAEQEAQRLALEP